MLLKLNKKEYMCLELLMRNFTCLRYFFRSMQTFNIAFPINQIII